VVLLILKIKNMYLQTSKAIKGYKTSKLAKTERNDCVVRAFASAFEVTYNQSHKLCEERLSRKKGKGVMTFILNKFLGNGIAFGKHVTEIKYDDVKVKKTRKRYNWYGEEEIYSYDETLHLYTKRGSNVSRMTVGSFLKRYDKGTYLISISSHMFTVKDGKVIGNPSDFSKKRVLVEKAWEVK
jgi:hypothetical protein